MPLKYMLIFSLLFYTFIIIIIDGERKREIGKRMKGMVWRCAINEFKFWVFLTSVITYLDIDTFLI